MDGYGVLRNLYIVALLMISNLTMCHADNFDPCMNSSTLLDMDKRHTNYSASSVGEMICDRTGIDDEGQWFLAVHNMPTEPPPLQRCGTLFPIWLSGSIPEVHDGIVERDACLVGAYTNCDRVYKIKVKNCTDGSAYLLKPTDTCPEAYCFGDGVEVPEEPPPGLIAFPRVRPFLTDFETKPGVKQGRLTFSCDFDLSDTEKDSSLLYSVSWYVDGLKVWVSPSVLKEDWEKTHLKESDGHLEKLNVQISCEVNSTRNGSEEIGPISKSDEFFAGIKVESNHLSIPRSGKANLYFNTTVPFGCTSIVIGTITGQETDCELTISMIVPETNNERCFGEPVGSDRNCNTELLASTWADEHFIAIKWMDGDTYETRPSRFQLTAVTPHHPIWNNLQFPMIQITPTNEENGWQGKVCRSYNDPHQTTFDGKMFENQNPGTFILYRHKDYNRPMEVQYQLFDCFNGGIFCMCGVAVRAGGDLFVIDNCEGKSVLQYVTCNEGILDARKYKRNERRYNIFFPTGTEVEVYVYGTYIDITIRPSPQDWKSTEGICGYLSDDCSDDFYLRNGSYSSVDGANGTCAGSFGSPMIFHCPGASIVDEDFNVPPEENLFLVQENEDIGRWNTTDSYCTCPYERDPGTGLFQCSSDSVVKCVRDRDFDKIGTENCAVSSKRSNKYPSESARKRRKKRSARTNPQSKSVHMTPEQAEQYCNDYMFSSKAFNACETVPNVPTEAALDICRIDIQLTSTLDWTAQTLESVKSSCIGELRKNYTLQEEGEGGAPSVAEMIASLVCPGNPECSGRGDCINGTCVCQDGYISSDCSTDITNPPEVIGLRGEGLCYTDESPCDVVYILGRDISKSPDLSCLIQEIKTDSNGNTQHLTSSVEAAHHDTLSEVMCYLPKETRQREPSNQKVFIHGYVIKLGYDTSNFGDGLTFYKVEAPCLEVTMELDKTTFTTTDGSCYINGMCVAEGVRSGESNCSVCDPGTSKFVWTSSITVNGCTVKLEVEDGLNISTVIWIAIGTTCLVIVAIVSFLVWFNFCRDTKKKQYVSRGDRKDDIK